MSTNPLDHHGEDDTDEIRVLYAGAREVETSKQLDGVPGQPPSSEIADIPGFKVLTSLMTVTIFTDYVHYRALMTYSHSTRQERVDQYCHDHRRLTNFCTVSDLILRWVVTAMVLIALGFIVAGAIYRTFYFR